MMELVIKGHDYIYETESVCRIFIGPEKIVTVGEKSENSERYLLTEVEKTPQKTKIYLELSMNGKKESLSGEIRAEEASDEECERRIGVGAYRLFSKILETAPPWGALTGIRPVKIARKLKEEGLSDGEIISFFCDKYLVSEKKAKLLIETERRETAIIKQSTKESFSLYIGIPFCPTRCRYCSFVSHSIERAKKLIPDYVDALLREIKYTGEIAKRLGLRLETVYVGGGTPTTLSAKDLERIMREVDTSFDMSAVKEFTVEAGRPDTVTLEKLETIKSCGADRISINPQTMNDKILELIGRKHTSQQMLEGYELARKVGFRSINTDVIAGLPEESVESFENTMDVLTSLRPENITVHTLSIKRSADLSENGGELFLNGGRIAAKMLDAAKPKLESAGYGPYYLYRQKNTLGSLENVGFSLDGYEGMYNVYIMDETHTVFSVGAGGSTKLKDPWSDRIERIFNYKFPYEYIEGFDEILSRKRKAEEFLNEASKQRGTDFRGKL